MTHTTSKQIKQAYEIYKNSNLYSLEHCYNNFSGAKQYAWDYCRTLEKNFNGYNLKIISFNTMCFSAGFIGEVQDNKTGATEKAFIYITKTYDRYIFINEI